MFSILSPDQVIIRIQGMAVLYKRKSDQKLVIIKEINLKEMTKDQRNLAINEGFFLHNAEF